MKRVILTTVAVLTLSVTAAYAQFPVFEGFFPPIQNTWDEFWTVDTTLLIVPDGTDGIADRTGGSGYFLKNGLTATAATSSGKVAGNETDTNYTVQAYIYTPVVNANAAPDDYWYQMLLFYRDANGYGRIHAHFNTDNTVAGLESGPRIRLQITNPTFVHTTVWTSPADFTHSQGWHHFKVEATGTTANCYYDSALLGAVDWTADAATRTAGRFGFGQYQNGAGEKYIYVTGFKAYQGSEPADPTPPLLSQNWSMYE